MTSVAQQEYDASSALTRTITSTKDYDELGRVIRDTDPLAKAETFRYDPAGNLAGKNDRNGNVLTYAYDTLNRPTSLSAALSGGTVDNTTSGITALYSPQTN